MAIQGRYCKLPKVRLTGEHSPADSLDPEFPKESTCDTIVQVTTYDADSVQDKQSCADFSHLKPSANSKKVLWIDVEGFGEPDIVHKIAEEFKIHPLIVEDVLTAHQRAKLEQYGDNFFLVTHLVTDQQTIETKQLSLYLGKNYVISFQDEPMDALEEVRERIQKNQGLIRAHGADYLTYALIDAVIDSYFPVLERLGERLEALEDLVIENPTRESIGQIHVIKRELLVLRRAMWPMREAINGLLRDGTAILGEEARLHLRDCYDHAVRVLDFIETYREVGADLMDVYLSSVSNRLNEVMKVLTIITTMFAVPTFIAGIYGMNFDRSISPFNMPETKLYFGYPVCLAVMLLSSLSMLAFFWSKGWLGVFKSGKHSSGNSMK